MSKTLKIAVTALCFSASALAQEPIDSIASDMEDEQAYTFTEAQLGDDETATQNITII